MVGVVEAMTTSVLGYAFHSWEAEDRLGNARIDFPIGFVYADRDWNGSEGANDIVRRSKHFKSGRSQIFAIKDSDHEMHTDQTDELVRLTVGFMDGSITGHFKPRTRPKLTSEEAK